MKDGMKSTYTDYKSIQEEATHIDCTITEADFYTSHPNPYRISYIVSDINRHLKYKGGQGL